MYGLLTTATNVAVDPDRKIASKDGKARKPPGAVVTDPQPSGSGGPQPLFLEGELSNSEFPNSAGARE